MPNESLQPKGFEWVDVGARVIKPDGSYRRSQRAVSDCTAAFQVAPVFNQTARDAEYQGGLYRIIFRREIEEPKAQCSRAYGRNSQRIKGAIILMT